MLADFQEGRRPRANAHASLLNTGHVSPQARRPGGGAVQHAHSPGLTARPGPRLLSAGQTMSANARNAQSERAVRQLLRHAADEVRLPSVRYAAYQPGASGRAPWQKTQDEFGQTWYATQVQHI